MPSKQTSVKWPNAQTTPFSFNTGARTTPLHARDQCYPFTSEKAFVKSPKSLSNLANFLFFRDRVRKVINRGPSVVREAELYLIWPTHNIHGDPLLYLLEPPVLRGAGSDAKRRTCQVVLPALPDRAIDPERLAVIPNLPSFFIILATTN